MAKKLNIDDNDKDLDEKSEIFVKRVSSAMHYRSELASDDMSFEWLDEHEFACPYIDNLIRNPKVALIKEEDVVKVEKAKKITVDSVKDLSKHTHFIEKVDKKTNDVQPSKILIVRSEQTFNIYENRFLYTLIYNMQLFLMRKEALLESIDTKDDKVLEYAASTTNDCERINIEVKIGAKQLPKETAKNSFEKEIEKIKARIKKE